MKPNVAPSTKIVLFLKLCSCMLWYCLFVAVTSASLYAQQPAPVATAPAPASGGLKLFFEKVYLHTDRDFYAAGDDIWYKAYLTNAQSNYLTNTSNNLYVELIAPDAKLVARNVTRLELGVGKGDFKLPDSIPAGAYKVRAYTNWMKNFGNNFLFEKNIQVYSTGASVKNGVGSLAKSTKALNIPAEKNVYNTQFLPEGGDLLEGVTNLVSFKADDINGNSTNVVGRIIASNGDTVARFASSFLGMGTFEFKPMPDITYKAMVKYKSGAWIEADLPIPFATGYALSISDADASQLLATVRTNAASLALHPSTEMTLIARHAGKAYFKEKLTVKEGSASISIPKDKFPSGIVAITLYDEKNRPNCERLVYVNNPSDNVYIALTTDKQQYEPKEKVTVSITATDANQKPVIANLSLAAVDQNMSKAPTNNIVSYLNLESELRGKIENAAVYFDTANKQRLQQLDLLLLTQGWRNFLWRRIADTSLRISTLPEPGITLSGTVRQTFLNKPLPNMNITLMASGAKGDKLYITKTNNEGRYFLDGLIMYGTQSVRLSSKDASAKRGGVIQLDTLFNNKLPIYPTPRSFLFDTSLFVKKLTDEATKRYIKAHAEAFDKNKLQEVVVNTNVQKTQIAADGFAEQGFGYPVYNLEPNAGDYKDYKTLENYLIHTVPGAVADPENEGLNFIANGKPVRPRFIIDDRPDQFDRIDYYTLQLSQVISVKVEHLVRNTGTGFRDVFNIRLKLKPGAFDNDLSIINAEITGYYEARNFYAPSYQYTRETAKPDLRATIFWEPEIVTDENGKAEVTFYNADPTTTIRLNVQGIAAKAIPVAVQSTYQVK